MGGQKTLRLAGLLAACAAVGAPLGATAETSCSANSGATSMVLVELYTSEGCSSCPPADRWLSGLTPGTVVPLALHVDYWDSIGWPDRFAQPRFSQRQRDTVRRHRGRVAYTPQVVLDGRDFPRWHDAAAFNRAMKEITARPARAKLALKARERSPGAWSVELAAQVAPRQGKAVAYLALYENGLESDIRAGENKGVRLRHDFVVRHWIGPAPAGADGRVELSQQFLQQSDVDFSKAGAAAFVQDPDTGEVLQALSLAFCRGGSESRRPVAQ